VIVIICMLYGVIGLFLVVGAAALLLRRIWRWARRNDAYEPQAADVPLDCGCDNTGTVYRCAGCEARRCASHREICNCPTTSESDTAFAEVEKVFAGQVEPDGSLIAPPDYQPAVVAGSDLDDDLAVGWQFELYDLIEAYRAGEPIERGAPRERL
jgi:hypothetical protein